MHDLDHGLTESDRPAHHRSRATMRSATAITAADCVPVPATKLNVGWKSAIGQRLKQSRMHWTVTGADSVIAPRCDQAGTSQQAA